MENDKKLDKLKSIYFSDKKDYNITMNKGGNPYHGKDGKFASAPGGSSISSAKERYEKIKTQIDNADLPQNVGQNEKKELAEARKAYRTELTDSIKSLNDDISNLQNEADEIYDEIDELESEYDEAKEMGDYAEAEDIRFEIKDKETLYDSDMSRIKELSKELDSFQDELSKLTESSVERFERERKEAADKRWKEEQEAEARRIKALTPEQRKAEEEAKKAAEKSYKEVQKKIDAITKKFGNSISEQVKDNSNRLTTILNAQSKGNPYHDKEGKFCSGPNTAFNIDSLSQYANDTSPYGLARKFNNEEAAEYVEQGIDGMQRLGISTSERSYDSSYQASKERVSEYLKNRTDKFASQLKKNDVSDILVIGEYMSDLASMMNKQYKKYASSISIKDSKKREFEVNQRKNQIDKLISRIEKHSQLQSRWRAAETYKLINDSSLGILQTLKYLD